MGILYIHKFLSLLHASPERNIFNGNNLLLDVGSDNNESQPLYHESVVNLHLLILPIYYHLILVTHNLYYLYLNQTYNKNNKYTIKQQAYRN